MASFPSPSVVAAAAAAPPRLAPGLSLSAAAVHHSSHAFRPRASLALRPSATAAPANPLRCTHRRAVTPRSRRRTQGLGAASASSAGILGEERDGCLSCFPRSRRRGRPGLARFAPCALPHTSGLSLHSRWSGPKTRRSHILRAAGPDEPHVASPTWSETALDKPYDPTIRNGALEDVLDTPLPSHPKLIRGQLKNGLRYLILPNKVPADRFEAHMEVHVGSIDEEEDEQGIAHMIEHVAFLGSKKREKLLGTGARSNAYTDFHHTVFHIHSPTNTKEYGESLLPSVLDALNEIAFHPKFSSSRVEKERRAILSELQMMNTIEYRVDCQLLQHLHSENKLSNRFPIGLEEQILKWDPDKIRRFHERWYYPANATLYLVGEIDDIPRAVREIEAVFEHTLSGNEAAPMSTGSPFGAMASLFAPKLPGGLAARSPATDKLKPIKRERQAVRPPVEHKWSLPEVDQVAKPPVIFQHELIQSFSINMFCKIPVNQVRTYKDLRSVLMKRIFLSALHFRINTRYKSSNPPFTSVELDHSDSGREGCTVTTLTVTAEPQNWMSAIKVAVHEVRRLKEFGVTMGEMTRYMDALIKDSEQLAMMIDSVPSVDNLDFIMESDALGHTVMDQLQGHESLLGVAETVTLEEVNTVGAEVLEFISDFGKPSAPLPAAIVACVPKKVHIDGVGESIFEICPEEITESMKAGLEEPIYPEPELEVPKELITQSELEDLKVQHRPSFVPFGKEDDVVKIFDNETGITQRRLSNGISVNYKITQNEARVGVMRLIVGGGRATEDSESKGSVIVGVRTLSEGGCVGNFSREQVELFCVNNLINCSLESNEEFIFMEFRFALRDNGMRAAFQLLHMVLEHNVWLEDAFDRAAQLYLSYYRSIPKSLERATAHKLMVAMLNHDERFVEPSPHSLQKLTLQSVKEAVMNQFVGSNMEVSVVGDFTEEEVESCVLDYLGTVSAAKSPNKEERIEKISFLPSPSDLHLQQVYIKDTDERACAYIAGPAPNRWGFATEGKDLFNDIRSSSADAEISAPANSGKTHINVRNHPLFFGIALSLLAEIINSRLFTTVRDSMGLTYDVSFELNLFDKLDLGWYVIAVTSTPSKVHKAVDACKGVLRGLHSNKIVERELDRAKRTLLMKHEAETKTNAYWLGLLAHLQSASVPRKDISCIKELTTLYESATIEDLYLAYEHLKVDDSSLFACIGIAGAESGEEVNDDEVSYFISSPPTRLENLPTLRHSPLAAAAGSPPSVRPAVRFWRIAEGEMATLTSLTSNANPNKSFEVLPNPGDSLSSLSFSPKSNLLVATSWDNQVRCWEIGNGNSQPKASISHDQPVLCSAWKDDGTTVFSGGCDKQVKMWPLLSGGQAQTVAMHDAPVKEVAWISQMNLLVSGSWDKTLRYWDTRQANPAHVQQLPDRCYALAVNYPLMIVGTADRNIVIFNLQNPQTEFKRIQSPLKYQTRCVAAFPDQQGFLVGSIEGRVGVHHIDDSQQSKNFTFKCHREGNDIFSVNSLNFHPVHHTFATAGSDGAFNFWDKDSKQRLKAFSRCPQPIPCSSFNNDGSIFAYGVCYDWSRGAENHNPANAKTSIYLHSPQEAEVKGKPRIATGRK